MGVGLNQIKAGEGSGGIDGGDHSVSDYNDQPLTVYDRLIGNRSVKQFLIFPKKI